jgi:membrane protease YdiL (CAAX protease family)
VLIRLRTLFTTVPRPAFWASLLGLVVALFVASWLLDRIGIAPWRVDARFLIGLGGLAAFGTAVVEEAVFRGVLLKPESGWSASIVTSILFALWHPFQTIFYHPLWATFAWVWWFLLGAGLLGLACARLTLATRSLWPAIVLHWAVAAGWKTLYGIPSCGPALGTSC